MADNRKVIVMENQREFPVEELGFPPVKMKAASGVQKRRAFVQRVRMREVMTRQALLLEKNLVQLSAELSRVRVWLARYPEHMTQDRKGLPTNASKISV